MSQLVSKHDILAAASGTSKSQPYRRTEAEPAKKLLAALVLTLGTYFAIGSFPRLRSNYICPQASFLRFTIPALQVLGTLLDVFLIIIIDRIISRGAENFGMPPVARLADPGWAALVSGDQHTELMEVDFLRVSQVAYSAMAITPLIFFHWMPIHRYWYHRTPGIFFLSAIKLGVVIGLICLCALQSVSIPSRLSCQYMINNQ